MLCLQTGLGRFAVLAVHHARRVEGAFHYSFPFKILISVHLRLHEHLRALFTNTQIAGSMAAGVVTHGVELTLVLGDNFCKCIYY